MENRKVVFVRHNFDEEIVQKLWEEKQIALRFRDIPSIYPEDYVRKFAQHAIRRLREYCREGVIVGASYRSYQPTKLRVGTIGPGDPDEMIRPIRLQNYYHKVVQLENVEEYSYRDYPILAIQPTHGTISAWRLAGEHLRAIYTGQPLAWSVRALVPSQLEVLCYEYLRMTGEIDALLLPIGRSLVDIDIYGIRASGEKTVAQVTQQSAHSKVNEKCQRLCEYEGAGVNLIFFGPREARFDLEPIRYIAIEDVFSHFMEADARSPHFQMIKHMLRR